jgi:hypothetical protein
MSVLVVFVSPCVFSPFPIKEMRADPSVENDVTNTVLFFRLASETNLINQIGHVIGL